MDFTLKPTQKVIVRFNDKMVMELNIDMLNMSISGTVTDEKINWVYLISGSIQEGD